MRTYIIGLNSFEVSVNTPISIYSKLNRVFAIEIGPLKPNCEINHISLSYLVLSVYEKCGNCPDYPI